MAWFYKVENDAVICTVKQNQEIYFFIPECYFAAKSAIIVGEYVNLLGIFHYAIYENGKPVGGLKTFKFSSIFLTQPYTIEKVKDITLTKQSGKDDYRILKYKPGDKLVVNINVPQQTPNIEEFIRLWVITGHIPTTLDYRNIYKYFLENVKLNGGKYGLNNQIIGVVQSELCRDVNDNTKVFRNSRAKKNGEWTNYKNVSVKDIPKYISPYVSLSSENFDDSLVAASLIEPGTGRYSPMERVVTGRYDS